MGDCAWTGNAREARGWRDDRDARHGLEHSRLKGRADFLSIGTNDLMQYFFAADRGNARVSDRYDILSPPALGLLQRIREDADEAGIPVWICGKASAHPLEAAAFAALGFTRLSMPAAGIGRVKKMLLSLDVQCKRKSGSLGALMGLHLLHRCAAISRGSAEESGIAL